MADEEFERFKRIKLHEYAASLGYAIDPKDSGRREVVMRKGDDKISVRCDTDGHYVYYSFRDPSDHGTVIDFDGRRSADPNFGRIRKRLRAFTGVVSTTVFEALEPAPRFNRAAVQAEYAGMKDLLWHDYLENERKLPRAVLRSRRFQGAIRIDRRGNAIFPHVDDEGVCGFEKRNRGFKGFADLGQKSLWRSAWLAGDDCLVVGESAIDCLSHAALFPAPHTRYASFAGGMSEDQEAEIVKACRSLPEGAEIFCITHPDPDGDRFADVLRLAAGALGFRVHRPEGVKDWNDELCKSRAGGCSSFPAVQK